MEARHHRLGREGERRARHHLSRSGYRVLEANYRNQKAEVDLIARRGQTVVFVEVKTRSSDGFGAPQDFVTHKKKRLLIQAARAFMREKGWDSPVRFDIIAILKKPSSYQLEHIEGAFETSEI